MIRCVVIVGSYLPSILNFRGDLIKTLVDRGDRVIVCAPDSKSYPEEIQKINSLGVIYREIPMTRTGLNPVKDLATLLAIRHIIKTEQTTHLLVYTIKPVVYGLLATIGLPISNKMALVTGLGYAFGENKGLKFKIVSTIAAALYKSALLCASRVVFQNPDDRQRFVDLNLVAENKARVVNGSGINVDVFKYVPLPENKVLRFLFIGRLLRDKGLYELIDAAKQLKADGYSFELCIVGWIDDNPNAIASRELSKWQEEGIINYLGKLSDVRFAIAESDVYILPSYAEGTPRTVLEAMSIGRAIITTDVPGCRETVVDNINGYLVKVKSTESIKVAMEKFLNNPSLVVEMGLQSRKIAEDKYSVVKVNKDMLHYMEEC